MVNFKDFSRIRNSKFEKKIQNSTFVRTTEKKIQKKFEKIQKWFEGRVAFEVLTSIGSHVNENEKKNREKL